MLIDEICLFFVVFGELICICMEEKYWSLGLCLLYGLFVDNKIIEIYLKFNIMFMLD